MIKPKKIVWKENKLGILNGYAGKIKCFESGWNVLLKEDREIPYTLFCYLLSKSWRFKTQEEAKKYAEQLLQNLVNELVEEN